MEMVKHASVAPRTVTEVSQGKHSTTKQRRTTPKRTLATTTRHIKVDDRVWKVATKLAAGDLKRIAIVNETEVIVRNPKEK